MSTGASDYGPTPQSHSYHTVTGLLVVPRAVGNPKLVRIHAEYGLRRVKFESHRSDRPPVIPSAGNLTNDLFVGSTLNVALPMFDPIAGGYNHTISGEYLYLQNVIRDSGNVTLTSGTARIPGQDPFPTGKYPYPLPIQDYRAADVLASAGLANPTIYSWQTSLGSSVVNEQTAYQWPFTFLPHNASDNTLIT